MTARVDNDEGLSSITIRSTFDKLSKRMYICASCSQELSVELYILHEGAYIRVSTISVPTLSQVAF